MGGAAASCAQLAVSECVPLVNFILPSNISTALRFCACHAANTFQAAGLVTNLRLVVFFAKAEFAALLSWFRFVWLRRAFEAKMNQDELVWEVINYGHCSFKAK